MSQELRAHARAIFDAGLKAADPFQAVKEFVRWESEDVLAVGEERYAMADYDRVLVVGAGKAACPMAAAMEELLGKHLATGAVTTKYGHNKVKLSQVEVIEAGHPVPDTKGLSGIRAITGLLESARKNDLVFCLISGGGSALMPLPAEGITLHEKQKTTSALLACGAAIHEINAVRKHISQVKGGQLARLAYPASLCTLILSDVVGDLLDVIASGPTVPDTSTFSQCLEIIEKYNLLHQLPRAIIQHLERGLRGETPEPPKPGDPVFEKTRSLIIGSSRQSLLAARDEAQRLGYNTVLLSAVIEGEAREVARVHAAVAQEIRASQNPLAPPACVLSGGETTVTLRGEGQGGRNQEFALSAAMAIRGMENVLILSAGTDGTDGPTDAAGAFADGKNRGHGRGTGDDRRGISG